MSVKNTMALPNAPITTRSLPLDVLRGVAMLLVLFRHPVVHASEAGVLAPLAHCMETIGWTGVDLFFVLSGFLIGGLLFNELEKHSRIDVRRFIIRRAFKIWPGYLALILLAFVQELRHGHQGPTKALHDVLPNLLHLQNYLWTIRGQTWSLAVEEHFYLFLPPLLLVLTLWKPGRITEIRAVPVIAGLLVIVCLGLRLWTTATVPFNAYKHISPTHLRMDSLFWGVLLGYLYKFRPAWAEPLFRSRKWLLVCGLALIAPMVFFDDVTPFAHTIGFTMLFMGYGCILIAFVSTSEGSGRLANLLYSPIGRSLAFVGFFSYAIYLWHVDFALAVLVQRLDWIVPKSAAGGLRWAVALLIYTAMATGAGIVMTKLIEQPALALRNRLWPSRTDASPAPSTEAATVPAPCPLNTHPPLAAELET
jgi:peptidoglycan/LPS O-acetylase OafA/YrhL